MGNSGLTRRGFLGAAGTGLAVSVSGCSSSDTDGASSDMSDIDIAKPVVQSDNMDGWKETNAREMKLSAQLGTTPYVSFRTFENVAFRSRVRGLTLGEFDSPLAKFFAAHIDLRGFTTIGATPERLVGPAAEELKANMKQSGIQNIHEVDVGMNISASAKQTREYEGEFHYDGFSATMEDERAGKITLEIEGGSLRVRGFVSTWKEDSGTGFAAGGAYPAEPFRKSSSTSITGEPGVGLDLKLSADLDLDPAARRAEIVALSDAVTVEAED